VKKDRFNVPGYLKGKHEFDIRALVGKGNRQHKSSYVHSLPCMSPDKHCMSVEDCKVSGSMTCSRVAVLKQLFVVVVFMKNKFTVATFSYV
jgi:hypothetical protein